MLSLILQDACCHLVLHGTSVLHEQAGRLSSEAKQSCLSTLLQRKRWLSDYSKWLERKKEEEKGGISKERRKWRWDHHVYLSWQRFHTSSLNQRSIEQTGIDIPANVGRSFFLLKYFVCYSICWRMKDKSMWLFLFKRINFLSFFQRSFW